MAAFLKVYRFDYSEVGGKLYQTGLVPRYQSHVGDQRVGWVGWVDSEADGAVQLFVGANVTKVFSSGVWAALCDLYRCDCHFLVPCCSSGVLDILLEEFFDTSRQPNDVG